MAGFVIPKRTFLLKFREYADDLSLNGLEVKARSCGIGEYMEILRERGDDESPREWMIDMCRRIRPFLISWNAVDEAGEPIPLDVDALLDLEEWVILEIIMAWQRAAVSVPTPLEDPSDSGAPSPEASIPMEALSGAP